MTYKYKIYNIQLFALKNGINSTRTKNRIT